jgi:hypothetical protein
VFFLIQNCPYEITAIRRQSGYESPRFLVLAALANCESNVGGQGGPTEESHLTQEFDYFLSQRGRKLIDESQKRILSHAPFTLTNKLAECLSRQSISDSFGSREDPLGDLTKVADVG